MSGRSPEIIFFGRMRQVIRYFFMRLFSFIISFPVAQVKAWVNNREIEVSPVNTLEKFAMVLEMFLRSIKTWLQNIMSNCSSE